MSSANSAIRFPNWLPPDAKDACATFYSLFQSDDSVRELRYLMQRLATRQIMKDVWAELKHFEEVTPGILMTLAVTAWLSARRHLPPRPGSAPDDAPWER